MADENNIDTPDEIEASEDQATPSQENAETPVDQPSGEQPAEGDSVDDKLSGEESAGGVDDDSGEKQSEEESQADSKDDVVKSDDEDAMLEMLQNLPKDDSGASPEEIEFGDTPASNAEFQQLSQLSGQPESTNIDLLMDINLPISIELGRTKMPIADILGLGPGSVVELNKLAGEPVDVLINQKTVARGEVVVIDENFGVRITQLLTPQERLKLLGEE